MYHSNIEGKCCIENFRGTGDDYFCCLMVELVQTLQLYDLVVFLIAHVRCRVTPANDH